MKNKTYLIIFVIFILAISLRSLNLQRGYFGDEAITLFSASAANLSEIISNLSQHDAYPPLTSILLHSWMKISQNEIFIRGYFILFGIGVLLIIYLIAREYVTQDRRFALLVLFLGAISPLLISLSQFIRSYIDSTFWILLSNYSMLLIIKNKATRITWVGYLVSALFSIYTFYLSAVVIFSQSIFIFIFKFKERGLIRQWIFSQIAIILLFSPWLPYFFKQLFNPNTSTSLHWERFGFKLVGLDLGIYARNISSLFGFDYLFMMYPEGIINHFGLPLVFIMAISAFLLLIFILFYTLRWLKNKFQDNAAAVWFLPFLSLLPVLIFWISVKIFKAMPYARYFGAPHSIFLILLACFFYAIISRFKKIGIIFLCSFISFYALRIPIAVTPPIEGNRLLEYLYEYGKEGDCIVMPDRLPGIEKLPIPCFNVDKYLYKMDQATSQYRELPGDNSEEVKNSLKRFKRIWLIRCYGNTEIFGGNKIIYDFLKRCGRKEIDAKEFNSLKLILME